MWLTNLAIRRRVTMIMIIGGLLVLGLTNLRKMPVEYFPKVDFPIVTVLTVYPGAGPEEIEQRVTKPIEDALAIINGVEDVISESQDGVSSVMVRFTLETNSDVAAADVRDAVTRARALFPDAVKTPAIYKVDIGAFPILSLGVTGNRSPRDMLKLVTDEVKPRLGQVRGVASVGVTGGEQREIRVEAHSDRLEAVGLSVAQLAQLVAAENLNVPAGELKQGVRSFAVRAMGQFRSVDEIRRLRVTTPLGGTVYLKDLADVLDATAEPTTIARINGKPSVNVDILKQSNANTVEVSQGVGDAIAQLKTQLPQDLGFTLIYDGAKQTKEAVKDVRDALILGALLAAFVTYLFLHNLRAMIIVVLAIPTSMIATFLPIGFFGFSVNVMVMLALSLAVGILVDDSVVVIENIERHRKMGEEPQVAALNGRAEIGGAAVAITLVDVVVFVPVAFMGSIVGQFFFAFGITITIATLFSLFMSFTLTPMLSSWWFRRETRAEQEREPGFGERFSHLLDAPFQYVQNAYRRVLPGVLRHPYLAVTTGYTALIVITVLSFMSGRVGFEFFPSQETGRIQVLFEAAPGTRIEVMDAYLKQIEKLVLDKQRYPEVQDIAVAAGTQGSSFAGAGSTGGQYGFASLYLSGKSVRRQKRQRGDEAFVTALRTDLADMPSVDVKVVRSTSEMSGTTAPLQLILTSPDSERLDAAATEIVRRMKETPGLLYPDVSAKPGRPEVRAQVDRVRAADMGLSAAQIAMALRTAYAGDTSSQYRVGGDEYDLRVQLTEFDRTDLSEVRSLFVGLSRTGQVVRLSDVADVYLSTGPARIERTNRERSVTIGAYLQGIISGAGQDKVTAIVQDLEKQGTMAGVFWRWYGEAQRMKESFDAIGQAMILAILLVYMVTAALYTDILQPWNVMLTVPQALGGAILALALTHSSLSLFSLIGIIMLFGIVGKNSILVVDYTNTLRARGMAVDDALLEAGPTRMRPIFMTSIAIIMGMLPTALALSEGAEFRAPMAIVVIGGTAVSTILSLLIVPSFYKITDGFERRYLRFAARLRRVLHRDEGSSE